MSRKYVLLFLAFHLVATGYGFSVVTPQIALNWRLTRRHASHFRQRPVVCQEFPRLGDVLMKPCKKLCHGCEPWICPMAPKDADPNEVSESTLRLLKIQEELAREAQLEQDRLALEAINAGVLDIVGEDAWREEVIGAPPDRLVAVLWGSKDCRKCKALKPKFIKLGAELKREIMSDTIFRYVDARAVGNARQQAGVKVVPLLQCWRKGEIVESYLAEGQLPEAEQRIKEIVRSLSASS